MSARDVQKVGTYNAGNPDPSKGKSFDTFTPLGPSLCTLDEYDDCNDIELRTRVDGEERQHARTSSLVFPISRLISFVSRFGTLEAGDVVLTGTPAHSRPMEPGDVVAVEIDGLGRVENTVVDWDVDLTEAGERPATSANTLHVALAIPEDEAERIVNERSAS